MSRPVSTASLQIPNHSVGSTFFYGTRDFQITPAASFTSSMRYGSTGTGAPLAWADLFDVPDARENALRVAAVVSRVLLMPDNGVLYNHLGFTAPVMNLHTENGCESNPYDAGHDAGDGGDAGDSGPTYGEACAPDGNNVWFGPALSYDDPNNPVLTGHHTTEEVFTIGHETGHSMQFASDGGPMPGGGDYSIPDGGMCGCNYVAVGNRSHCMESLESTLGGEVEGWGHFYATRIMNDQDSVSTGARFNYYKEFNLVTPSGSYGDAVLLERPPVPINFGSPFNGHPNDGGIAVKGWARYECGGYLDGGGAQADEYDFSTFLWAINGNAPAATRASIGEVYAIVGDGSLRGPNNGGPPNFTWTKLAAASQNFYGFNTAKDIAFRGAGTQSGLDTLH